MASGQGPEVSGQGSGASEWLLEAAMGRAGVDRRLIRRILEADDAPRQILNFAREPREDHRLELDPLLVDLFHHFQAQGTNPEALEFYIDAIRRNPEDAGDELIQAILPYGEQAVAPLLALYEELGEEQGSDVAFLLAGLRVHDPRVLALLLERLEYDAADGAFTLGLYGDPVARQALEEMLGEIPAEDAELRREIGHALEQLDAPQTHYEPEPFDIFDGYSEIELPVYDVLPEAERLTLLESEDALIRAGAAHSFFNHEVNAKARTALLNAARSDADPKVRGRSWESLADATQDAALKDEILAVLNDASKPVEERGGAAVGLYAVGDEDGVKQAIEKLYEEGGDARIKALEAMWRSLWQPYAKFFPEHLDSTDPRLLRQVLRGAGYFELTRHIDKIASFLDREEPFDDLREDALFAYAMAMPGETTRGRVRGMVRKIEALTPLTAYETELVEFALDERLRLHGLQPVFDEENDQEPEAAAAAVAQPEAPAQKPGRNDPCPCGSGKKYKKCCGR